MRWVGRGKGSAQTEGGRGIWGAREGEGVKGGSRWGVGKWGMYRGRGGGGGRR